MIVDYTQVRMFRPSLNNLLVKFTCKLKSFCTFSISSSGIELFCSIRSTHKVKNCIITSTKFLGSCSNTSCNLFPHLWLHISRDIHCTTITYYNRRFINGLSHTCKLIFQSKLHLQCCLLSFIEERGIIRKIIHTRLREERWNFWNDKHFITKT